MTIIPPENGTEVFNQNGCLGTRLLVSEGIEIVRLTVAAKSAVAKHALPFPVIFYVLEGEGALITDTEICVVDTGTTIECPPDMQRGWENRSAKDLKLLVIKRVGK